jgi:hypothetical protein
VYLLKTGVIVMQPLTIESFFSADTDWEINQYRILGGIKEFSSDFDHKKIYPALAKLIEISSSLEQIKNQEKNLKSKFPKQIEGFDINEQKIIFNSREYLSPDIEFLFKLIDWALPHLKAAIEEGIILFEFVEKNIDIEQVGILPIYKDEGYFMITDNIASELQIHRYECSLFSSGSEKYRALKTELVKSEKHSFIRRSPDVIKHELIKERHDLPNPATFVSDTDLDFPFTETIFPVAKRKLIAQITS